MDRSPNLDARDVAYFRRLGISSELLARAGVERVTDLQARESYGIKFDSAADLSGIIFPYFSIATGDRVTASSAVTTLRSNEVKQRTSISAYGDRKHLYFPPGAVTKLQKPDTHIVLVEAEKSALALTAYADRNGANLVAVAMGGAWGWRGRIGKVESPFGGYVDEKGPLPDLDWVNGRDVYVLLDSDVLSNANVHNARTGSGAHSSGF